MRVAHSPAGPDTHPPRAVSPNRRRLKRTLFLVGGALLLMLLMAAGSFLGAPSTASNSSGPALSTPVELTTLAQGEVSANLRDSQGHFHLLYITTTAQHSYTLMYEAVSVSGRDVQTLIQPVSLTSPVDAIFQPTLLLDSQGRIHAAWIDVSNGIASVRHAVVSNPDNQSLSIVPDTLYSLSGAINALSAGADGQGDTFYAWLDNANGPLNLRFVEIDTSLVIHTPVQVTHQTELLSFAHLAVYPNGTLAALMLRQPDIETPADLSLYPFDAAGTSLHAPTLVANQLQPEPLNVAGSANAKEPDVFENDPLAARLDAQGTLHIAWAAAQGLGYARATLHPDDSFTVQANPALDESAQDYQQLCLNVGPPISPGQATASSTPQVWLSWIDDRLGDPSNLHPYFAQVSAQGTLIGTPSPLVDQLTAATNPCVQQDSKKGLYVTWQQFDESNNYALVMATTTVAPSNPWWAALGLSLNHPIEQLIFIVFGSPVVALFLLLITVPGIPVEALVIRLGKWLHIPRLVVLLITLIPILYLSIFAQGFLAANFNASVALIRSLVGCAVIVGITLYLWYRSRRFPPETLGTIGQLLLATYIGAIILAAPIIYLATRTQLG